MYPCDPTSFNCMKIRGEASYYTEIKDFVKYLFVLIHVVGYFYISMKLGQVNIMFCYIYPRTNRLRSDY